jgi:hypothetical protein
MVPKVGPTLKLKFNQRLSFSISSSHSFELKLSIITASSSGQISTVTKI